MIIAALWPAGPSGGECEADPEEAARAGRFIAAAGHSLLLAAAEGPARRAGEAYRAAGGGRLIGILPEGSPAPPADLFDELISGIPAEALLGRICAQAGAVLCAGGPDSSLLAACRASGALLYVVAALSGVTSPEESPPAGPGLPAGPG
ncbi:MAG: hypothetical protein V3V62_06075, partial [bacterium]